MDTQTFVTDVTTSVITRVAIVNTYYFQYALVCSLET